MDYSTFIGEVQNRAQLPSREAAVKVTRITLETLSTRVDPNAAENLAAQLPEEVGHHLAKVDELERFDWDAFVDRIVEQGDYGEDERADAVFHARVVADVVAEAVDGHVLFDVRDQLPEGEDGDWDELWEVADQETEPVEEEQRAESE